MGFYRLMFVIALSSAAMGQPSRTRVFEVASVKPSARLAGPDYNNQLTISQSGITARNATLRRLVAEAYGLQVRQISGPGWLDQNEYDLEARTGEPVERKELDLMLRALLADRFQLRQHHEQREMRVYELVVDKGGPKIQPAKNGETPRSGSGFHFRGSLRQFADLLAVQLSIPISDDPAQPARAGGPMVPLLDKTGLTGIYDISADLKPETGLDSFSLWQRILREQLGLRMESRRERVETLVVDEAAKMPAAN
ncbi:MAG TPA: TIGR03435 family protein [Bryobacteraceae bacterium]|nr:TIGR03435 family protein [Bryobacteraceae bacterium]